MNHQQQLAALRANDLPRLKFTDVPHPTNRVWPGTPWTVMLSVEDEFLDGHVSGLL